MSEHTIQFVRLIGKRFSNLHDVLKEHMSDNEGEILPHVFFGDLSRYAVSLISPAVDKVDQNSVKEVAEILEFLEESFSGNDGEVQELISVSFLENLPKSGEEGFQIREMIGPNLRKQLRTIG